MRCGMNVGVGVRARRKGRRAQENTQHSMKQARREERPNPRDGRTWGGSRRAGWSLLCTLGRREHLGRS